MASDGPGSERRSATEATSVGASTPAPPRTGAAAPAVPDLGALRAEDFTVANVPTVMRGYERRRVEWLLLRASDAYAYVVRQRDTARERIRALEGEVAATESEARVSAASVAELVQQVAAEQETARRAIAARDEAERRLASMEDEHRQALADLQVATDRASSDPDAEAASILVASVRAAEEIRRSSRARALATLARARERATAVAAEMEREQGALADARERRLDAERVAGELLERARAEAERVAMRRSETERLAAEVGDERRRVQELLVGALSALDPRSREQGG